MATETIRIVITLNGERVVQNGIRKIGQEAKQSSELVSFLKRALLGFGAVEIVRGLANTADAYRFIQNRLRVVTKSTAELATVQERLFRVARESRADLRDTAEIYSRMAFAARNLKVSQEDVINATSTLNKIVAISGTRVKEASNALIQFSQGLSSNRLAGDELRAVLEQMPFLANIIAQEMGISYGQLRKFASEGKVTADIIFQALRNAREQVDDKFKSVLPTVASALIVLKNAFTQYIGKNNEANNITGKLADVILALADNFDVLTKATLGLASGLTILAGRAGIQGVVTALNSLRLAMLRNPLAAFLTIITTLLGLLYQFRNDIAAVSGTAITLGDVLATIFGGLRTFFQNIGEGIRTVISYFDILLRSLGPVGEVILGLGRAIGKFFKNMATDMRATDLAVARFLDRFVTFSRTLDKTVAAGIKTALQGALYGIEQIWDSVVNRLAKETEEFVNGTIRVLNVLSPFEDIALISLGRLENSVKPPSKTIGQAMAEAWKEGMAEGFTGAEDFVNRFWDKVDAESKRRLSRREIDPVDLTIPLGEGIPTPEAERKGKSFDEILKGLKRQVELLKMTNREREIAIGLDQILHDMQREDFLPGQKEVATTWLRRIQLQEESNALMDELRGETERLTQAQKTLNDLYENSKITLDEWTRKALEFREAMSRTNLGAFEDWQAFFDGVQNGFDRLMLSAYNFGELISDWVVGSFEALADAIVNFAETGKFAFREFASSVVRELLRITTQMLILKALGFIFSSLGEPPLPGLNSGAEVDGVLTAKTGAQFMVGGSGGPDSQMVQFRASPNERVTVETPAQAAASDRAKAGNGQNLTIVNVIDPEETLSAMRTSSGERIVLNVIERNPQAIRRLLGSA